MADQTDLLVADTQGATKQLNTNPGIFFNPFWSQESEKILVGGDGVRIFDSRAAQPAITIIETQLGYCYHPQWQP